MTKKECAECNKKTSDFYKVPKTDKVLCAKCYEDVTRRDGRFWDLNFTAKN